MTGTRARIRARRDGWAADEKLIITKRDLEILYLAGVCGVVRTRDVTRFAFGARATANDRLRKLYCAGLLECFVPDLASDNYYALTPRGRDHLVEAYDIPPDDVRVVRKLPKHLDHALAVTEMRLHIALACRASTTYKLGGFETDAELAKARHAALLELIPDAKVTIIARATGEVHTLMAELDLGTEPTNWLVRHKLAVYARYAALGTALYGVRNPPILLVVPSLRRARNIARTMVDQRVLAPVVFALRPLLTEGNVLGRAYALPQELLAAAPEVEPAALFRQRLLP